MLIKFYNLGSIKETELDLRPLTVIIGPNNSNKTYIAYSVYALWATIVSSFNFCLSAPTKGGFPSLEKLGFKSHESHFSLSIKDFVDSFYEEFSRNFSIKRRTMKKDSMGERFLEDFFSDSSDKLFKNTEIHFDSKKDLLKIFKENAIRLNNSKFNYLPDDKDGVEFSINIDNDVLYFKYNRDNLKDLNTEKILISFFDHLFPYQLCFPPERNAFILIYKLLINSIETRNGIETPLIDTYGADRKGKLPEEPFINNKKKGHLHYPEPVEDFLNFLKNVESSKSPSTDNNFQQIADYIEKYLYNKNKINFKFFTSEDMESEDTESGDIELKLNVKKNLDIDLHNASSSIKQLSPLVLYLRYQAKVNDFLIIDEPELGLHPESQAKLLEIIAIMVNLGIRILITTHSPYFMSHLNNIVSGEINNPEILTQQASSLYLNDSRAFLSMDQVSAYEMKKNKLRSLKDEDFGIRWDTLSDVSSDIQQKYFEIYKKKEMFSNGKK